LRGAHKNGRETYDVKRRSAAIRLIVNRWQRSGLGQGALGVSAGLLSAGLVSAGAGVAFGAGFFASPQPVTAIAATSSVAANSCFMVRSPEQMGKTVTRHRGDSLNITMSQRSA
jgi:hypothetical protein